MCKIMDGTVGASGAGVFCRYREMGKNVFIHFTGIVCRITSVSTLTFLLGLAACYITRGISFLVGAVRRTDGERGGMRGGGEMRGEMRGVRT